jgi:galactitol-specific phosphotransferase system IIC component
MGGVIIILGLGSLVFLSAMLIVMALFMRSRWDQMGQHTPSRHQRTGE